MATDSWINRVWLLLDSLKFNDGGKQVLRTRVQNESQFGEVQTASRTPIIENNSSYGVSALRDLTTTTGSGSVTNGAGVIVLATGSTATSSAQLEASESGRYMPGYSAQIGIGVRLHRDTTGNEVAKWGGRSFDGQDGIHFGRDASGWFVVVRRNGSETRIDQADWNIDRLDGTGVSGLELDVSKGNVFQLDFTWYGFGQILFSVVAVDTGHNQRVFPLHSERVNDQVSIDSPNLRPFGLVDNGGDATDLSMDVGGRQYSIVGRYSPRVRSTCEWRDSVDTSTTFVPLISFRRKNAFRDRTIKPSGFDTLAESSAAIVQIRVDGELTGASFGTPSDHDAAETAVESDTAATAISGGIPIWTQIVEAGAGRNVPLVSEDIDIDVPDNQVLTLCARTISGSGSITSAFRISEEW